MTNYLEGPDEKLKRAYLLIDELKAASDRFLFSDPSPYSAEKDLGSEPGRCLYRAVVREEPPISMALILGDILHNLRSSLDFVAWQCVLHGGGDPNRATGFPISDTEADFERDLRSRVAGATAESLNVIRSAEPYKGGNDLLWQLHHLNRFDKHRLLPIVAGSTSSVGFNLGRAMARHRPEGWPAPDYPYVFMKGESPAFPLRTGDVITSQPAEEEVDIALVFYIGFGQGGYAEGQNIVDTSRDFAKEVGRVIGNFRAVFNEWTGSSPQRKAKVSLEVRSAILAQAATVADGRLYVHGGQLDTVWAKAFPTIYPSLAIAFIVQFEYSMVGESHDFAVYMRLGQKQVGDRIEGSIQIGQDAPTDRAPFAATPLALTFNGIQFDKPGQYEFVVSIDGEIKRTLPLVAVLGEPP